MTRTVAVVGARGFVGAAITAALERRGEHRVIPVVRSSYEQARRQGPFDVVINAACPSRRFWAEQHPAADHLETVRKTEALVRDWAWGRFVQISSMSARTQQDTVYGRHRAEAERVCGVDGSLVVRLGPMYGRGCDKGALLDLLAGRPVYASGESRQSFAPVEWCAGWVAAHLDETGVWEIGARTAITLREVRDAIGSRSPFVEERRDDQFPVLTPAAADWPVAADVIGWLRRRRLTQR